MLNDELTASGSTVEEVVWTLLDQMNVEELEIVTLYYGNGLTAGAAAELGEAIRAKHPHLEVEVVEGGQPHYDYIMSAD